MEGTAVVIGSGMGGLAAAQVLSKHFNHVLVIERDEPARLLGHSAVEAAKLEGKARPGVAQYDQLHAMLAKGLQLYNDIFEGRFASALTAAGGRVVDQFKGYLVYHPATGTTPWLHTNAASRPIPVALATRHLFESTARRLVTDNPRVQFMYGVSVTGLVVHKQQQQEQQQQHRVPIQQAGGTATGADGSKQHGRVSGITLSDGCCVSAQLVVDCSGRGSSLPTWLAAAGYERPRTSRAGCNAGYAGWLCKLTPEVEAILDDNGIHAVVCFPHPPIRTLALLLRVEAGLCIAGVGGNDSHYPSKGQQQVLDFAMKEVWHPGFSNLLAGSCFKGPIDYAQHLSSTWRHYEDVVLPDGLLVMGDAVCSLSPTYAQGMTLAAEEAVLLGKTLAQRAAKAARSAAGGHSNSVRTGGACNGDGGSSMAWLTGLNQEFQQGALPMIKSAWALAAGSDMRFQTAYSNEPINSNVLERIGFAYTMELMKLAGADAVVCEALSRVIHLLESPTTLLHPALVLRVLVLKAWQLVPAGLRRAVCGVVPSWLTRTGACGACGLTPGAKAAALLKLMGSSKLT